MCMYVHSKGKVGKVPVHANEVIRRRGGGVVVQLYPFLTSALDVGDWTTSRPGRFTLKKEPQCPLNKRLGGPQSRSG
jgi:hypothetical protein